MQEKAASKSQVNDTSGLGAQPWVLLPCAGPALWQLMITAAHTKPGKPRVALRTWDTLSSQGSSSSTYSQRDVNFSWPVCKFLTGDCCTQSWYFNICLESRVWKTLISALLLTTKPSQSFSQFWQNLEIKNNAFFFPNEIATPVVQPTGHLIRCVP